MDWLNYHHLLYFWQVAHEGSITRASEKLHLTPQTISSQLHDLEESLGEKLFVRRGRSLELTETGRDVVRYADEIFSLGRELLDSIGRVERGPHLRINIGVADVLPKHIVEYLIDPVFRLKPPVRAVVHEDKTERLLAEIAVQAFDVVLTDAPMPSKYKVQAFNHLLGACDVTLLATGDLAKQYRKNFPDSLQRAPFLLPTMDTELRSSLDRWFDEQGIRPSIVSEFADNALLVEFGEEGYGIFAVPSVIEDLVRRQHHVVRVGRIADIEMRFYAISVEKKIKHPAVSEIFESARQELFK